MPFFRLLIPFLAGIIFQIYLQTDIPFLFGTIVMLGILLLAAAYFKPIALSYRLRSVFGSILTCSLFLSGVYLVTLKTESRDASEFSNISEKEGFYYVRLHEPYLEKDRSLKVVMDVLAVKKDNAWISSTGKAMFYIAKDSLSEKLRYGDCLVVKTSFTEVPSPKNPSEFNYKQYLYFHNIYRQAYVRAGEWKTTGENTGNTLLRWSYSLRDELLDVLKQCGLTGEEYSVTAALVLGYEDKLDPDIISAYSSTGALHVLSVSGLHVGIIYFVFNLVFSFLDKRKRGHIAKTFLLLFVIWFYATLTGLSPSVLRSAAMFTFIIVGKGFRLSTDIFNTLAVSCFVLLMFDPYLVMEVGFQLSFLAVFGIIFIQPRMYDLWRPKTKVMDWIWALTTVSLAAQLITFPLGLLYFHQFPNLFLFSNLVVIPVSTILLYLGILLFFVWKIAFIGPLVAKLLWASVWVLNHSVKFMETLPHAMIQGITISIFETWLIYGMIAFVSAFLFNRRRKYLLMAMASLAVVLSVQAVQNHFELRQKRFIVYSAPRSTAIDLVSGKKDYFISDPGFMQNKSRMLFHVKHNWWDSGLNEQVLLPRSDSMRMKDDVLMVKEHFIHFYDKTILLADSNFRFVENSGEKIKVDYLLICAAPEWKLEKLFSLVEPQQVIFDNSNPAWKIRKWKSICEKNNMPSYDTNEQGAFVAEL